MTIVGEPKPDDALNAPADRALAAADRDAGLLYLKALQASGERFRDKDQGCALLPSRLRMKDLKTMNDQRAKVLFADLIECTSARGSRYLKGWAGACSLLAFPGEADDQGRPTWKLYLTERASRSGTVPDSLRQRQERASAAAGANSAAGRFEDAP